MVQGIADDYWWNGYCYAMAISAILCAICCALLRHWLGAKVAKVYLSFLAISFPRFKVQLPDADLLILLQHRVMATLCTNLQADAERQQAAREADTMLRDFRRQLPHLAVSWVGCTSPSRAYGRQHKRQDVARPHTPCADNRPHAATSLEGHK